MSAIALHTGILISWTVVYGYKKAVGAKIVANDL